MTERRKLDTALQTSGGRITGQQWHGQARALLTDNLTDQASQQHPIDSAPPLEHPTTRGAWLALHDFLPSSRVRTNPVVAMTKPSHRK